MRIGDYQTLFAATALVTTHIALIQDPRDCVADLLGDFASDFLNAIMLLSTACVLACARVLKRTEDAELTKGQKVIQLEIFFFSSFYLSVYRRFPMRFEQPMQLWAV